MASAVLGFNSRQGVKRNGVYHEVYSEAEKDANWWDKGAKDHPVCVIPRSEVHGIQHTGQNMFFYFTVLQNFCKTKLDRNLLAAGK